MVKRQSVFYSELTPHASAVALNVLGLAALLVLWLIATSYQSLTTELDSGPFMLPQPLTQADREKLCGLRTVECPEEHKAPVRKPTPTILDVKPKTIRATVTTYQALPEQTDSNPCSGAMAGMNFCNPKGAIVANNCLPLGTYVAIRGDTYYVADRMAPRFGCDHFDILTDGENFTLTDEPVAVLGQ